MASSEKFLDDYEISRLVCDSDDSEDDRHSDAVEEDPDDDIDSMYVVADIGDHGQPENTDDENSEKHRRGD
jgi:hypothetical protein